MAAFLEPPVVSKVLCAPGICQQFPGLVIKHTFIHVRSPDEEDFKFNTMRRTASAPTLLQGTLKVDEGNGQPLSPLTVAEVSNLRPMSMHGKQGSDYASVSSKQGSDYASVSSIFASAVSSKQGSDQESVSSVRWLPALCLPPPVPPGSKEHL
ncbi:unnamed protein product [Polarella glacialis]|uniref:Uncharacterized protein n=1 Tax=Polarella glacialis TaxID=89957 RepID=A0A813FR13_POLGL|nr:unnamed protein product [Polarella glacialis]